MAQFTLFTTLFSILATMSIFVFSQPPLDRSEQEAVYSVLESINSAIPWRALFPDDLCISAPHGVVCDYFPGGVPHVTELSFGYVSDYSPNPPCLSNSTLNPNVLLTLSHLRKLFFYKCFTDLEILFPDFSILSSQNRNSSLEELVFIENPALVGSLEGKVGKLTGLKRLVVIGSSFSEFGGIDELVNLEQLTLSRNKLKGEISSTVFQNLNKLKVLDLSDNEFHGTVPDSIGNLTELIKIDLSYNGFSGRIPDVFKFLTGLEFLDLSYNRFGNYGIPLFLSEMQSLNEVYLSGNILGGQIPENIWKNLDGIKGIGLSSMGLVGDIPRSLGVYLRNVCYLGLDNNSLEGVIPDEFGGLEFINELNLENNMLSGRVPFSAGFVAKLGGKLKVEGNLDLCIDEGLRSGKIDSRLRQLKACREMFIPKNALVDDSSCSRVHVAYSCLSFIGFLLWVVGLKEIV